MRARLQREPPETRAWILSLARYFKESLYQRFLRVRGVGWVPGLSNAGDDGCAQKFRTIGSCGD